MKKTINLAFIFYLFLIITTILLFQVGLIQYINFQKFKESNNLLLYRDNIAKDINFGGSFMGKLDIYYDENNIIDLKPVVIFVHGGGWIKGDKNNYIGIGYILKKEGYVAILPNHILFPDGSIDAMVSDVYKSIEWTIQHISEYGGDKNKIILVGFSAGAHLLALTTFKVALGIENHGQVLDPFSTKIQKLVLFNGPYDFDSYDHITSFFTRKEEVNHGIIDNIVGLLNTYEEIAPTAVLKKIPNDFIKNFGYSKINLFYSDKDELVPTTCAPNLIKQIHRISPNTVVNSVFSENHGFGHYTLVNGAKEGNEELKQMFMDIIKM